MRKIKSIENIILVLLWTLSLSTFTTALINNYALLNSDYVGIGGLIIATAIFFIRPDKKLESLLFLLILGTFNLASFIYFFNYVFTFQIATLKFPGIQMLSAILLIILVLKKRYEVLQIVRKISGTTEEDNKRIFTSRKMKFKEKFKNLSEKEINKHLENNLQPEARSALTELKKEKYATTQCEVCST